MLFHVTIASLVFIDAHGGNETAPTGPTTSTCLANIWKAFHACADISAEGIFMQLGTLGQGVSPMHKCQAQSRHARQMLGPPEMAAVAGITLHY